MSGVEVLRRRRRPNFAAVPYEIARDGTLSDKALRLWVILESHADYDDRDAQLTMATLARECGHTSVRTIQRVQTELIERGLLEVQSGRSAGCPNVYIVCDGDGEGKTPMSDPSDTSVVPPQTPMSDQVRHPCPTEQEPSNEKVLTRIAAAPLKPKATDDPLRASAHRLTVLAMEQPVKPDLRGGGNPFPAVMTLFERILRQGRSVQECERAVLAGIEVWTLAGIQTSIARAHPRLRTPVHRDGDQRSLEEIMRSAAGGGAR